MAKQTARQKREAEEAAAAAAAAAKHAAMMEERARLAAEQEAARLAAEAAREKAAREAADALVERLKAVLVNDLHRVVDFFNSLDTNGDGLVSKEEWRGLATHLSKRQAAQSARKGGRTEKHALIADPRNEDAMDKLFDQLDADQSGTISYKELHTSLRQSQFEPASRRRAPSSVLRRPVPFQASPGAEAAAPSPAEGDAEGDAESAKPLPRKTRAEIAIERLQARSQWLSRGPARPRTAFTEEALSSSLPPTLTTQRWAGSPPGSARFLAVRRKQLIEGSSAPESRRLLATSGTLARVRTSTPRGRRILPTVDWHAPPQVLPKRPLVPPLEPRPLSIMDSTLLGL